MPCGNRLADLGFTDDSVVEFVRDWYADGGTIREMALFMPGMTEPEIADICFGRERPRKSPRKSSKPETAPKRKRTGGRLMVPVIVDGGKFESIQNGAAMNDLSPKSLASALSFGRTELCGRTIAYADPERERERLERGRDLRERECRKRAEKRAESRRTGGPPDAGGGPPFR